MNLSCSGGGLPESGCLFFKIRGTTNTTEGNPEKLIKYVNHLSLCMVTFDR